MDERVVITGLGVVSSLGSQVDEFWEKAVKGTSGISQVSSFDTSNLERHYAGEVKEFKPFLGNGDKRPQLPRTQEFAISASRSAISDSGLTDDKDMTLIIGSLAAGLEIIEDRKKGFNNYPVSQLTANVVKTLNLSGPAFTLSCACGAGNYALSFAYDMIKTGREKVVLAGGADYFSMSIFLSFYKLFSLSLLQCKPFDKNRRGLLPAEGAGMLVVESLSSATERKAHIYAEILGYGMSVDATHPVIPSENGVYSCMEDALNYAGLSTSDIDYISAHGTGTIPNDRTECTAIKRLFGDSRSKELPISSLKSMLGHAMGAASSIEAISCCLALENGIIPPTINYEVFDPECDINCVPNKAIRAKLNYVLNNSFGFGGMNCSLVLSAFKG